MCVWSVCVRSVCVWSVCGCVCSRQGKEQVASRALVAVKMAMYLSNYSDCQTVFRVFVQLQ